MQTSKEVVKNAIEFTKPDRLPVIFDSFGVSDVKGVNWNQIGTGDNSKRLTYDEWHCGWQRTDVKNMGQITIHPIKEWTDIDSFSWPDPDDPAFYTSMEAKFEGKEGYYITTGFFMLLFERLHGLRGFENTLMDLYLEREKAEALADWVVEFDLRVIENMERLCRGRIDGFRFSDDWGTEIALVINPKLWKDFFMPRYKKIFDKCHEYGWHVWMHSCGRVNEIIEPLIEIGCNVLNLQQPRVLGIEEIGKRFAGRVCFETACDIQRTLPSGRPEEIEEEAKLLLDCWGTDRGGFLLSSYGDSAAIGAAPESADFMFEAFQKHDRWRAGNCTN